MRLLLLLLLTSLLLACQAPSPTRPNVLLILVDDMGYSDLSCYGSEIATPHIDALANNGMRFTQFYNAARCCPSRAALLTGRYPHEVGMGHQNRDLGVPSYRGRISLEAATLAEALAPAGYATYHVGKWHVGSAPGYWPGKRGFEQEFTLVEGAMSYYNQWPWVRGQDTLPMTWQGQPYRTPPDFFATDAFADTAATWLGQHAGEAPFFMYLAFNAPHWPLHAKEADLALYRGAYEAGWDSLRAHRHRRMLAEGLLPSGTPLSPRAPEVPAWESLSDSARAAWTTKMELYAAVMHRLDLGVGRVVEALRRSGQLDNTLILFLSDNGACPEDPTGPWSVYPEDGLPGSERSFPAYLPPWANASNTPYRLYKSWLHEGGIRTPLIAHWPAQVPAGKVNTETVGHIIDLMPTLLDLAGAPATEPLPGLSLSETLAGRPQSGHDTLYWEHQYNRAIRAGDWKLVWAQKLPGIGPSGQWELYDLSQDPVELQDVAAAHPERVAALAARYEAWAAKVGAYDQATLDSLKQQ